MRDAGPVSATIWVVRSDSVFFDRQNLTGSMAPICPHCQGLHDDEVVKASLNPSPMQ